MAFRSEGRSFYKTRVSLPDGRAIVAGCGTDDLATAEAMERMLREFSRKRQVRPLELIVERKAKLTEIFDACERGDLDGFIARLSEPDLVTLLDEWAGNAKYKRQIRRLFRESFPASCFTRRRISEFLASLPVGPSTKNRYRAALSVFAAWLVEREVIPHNPVRDVAGYGEPDSKVVWLERGQAQALIDALPMPNRALEALMAATGVEWQVIERLRRRDVDFTKRSAHAQGGKTPWRNRIVRATELWAWEIFAEYARDFASNALIFDGLRESQTLRVHSRTAKSLGLPHTTLHDWRHVYAVQALRDGYKPAIVAHQLGHRDSYLVLTRYGRFIPNEADYVLHAATPSFHAEIREA
jgi:integrase